MNVTDRDLTDDELAHLDQAMDVVRRMPHQAVENIVRHVLRVAIYYRRTRDAAALESAARSILSTVRIHRDSDDVDLLVKARHGRHRFLDPGEVLAKLRR